MASHSNLLKTWRIFNITFESTPGYWIFSLTCTMHFCKFYAFQYLKNYFLIKTIHVSYYFVPVSWANNPCYMWYFKSQWGCNIGGFVLHSPYLASMINTATMKNRIEFCKKRDQPLVISHAIPNTSLSFEVERVSVSRTLKHDWS